MLVGAMGEARSPTAVVRAAPRPWLPWIVMAAIFGVAAVALRLEGQRWWCACSQRFLWVGDVWTSHCSRHLADAYTLTHFSHGLIFFSVFALLMPRVRLAWRLCVSVALAAAWEVFENSEFVINRYRESTMSVEYLGDSVLNSLGDMLACVLGFAFARRFGIVTAMLVFVVIEIALMIAIRDNLTVGTLMLVFPIDVIREWQLAAAPPGAGG
jgi:hypothetical protein